ncbi:hypothetical protein [Fibrella forsythiae]|uniref:Uncharacterized protein n=1 Tax=Fibrella forsythiae TaxID=2817061 RepID=A0ABS3JT79_9BACT|nr:hypothetical protein [Fibrella forsythiae]MBO0953232.1 hypothetical protein [Fibrella forsythiae]
MNTVQNYAHSMGGATPIESIAQTLQQQLETLQNVVLTLGNPTFRAKYSYVATASEQQLSQALAEVIVELDPLLVEALA